jgi:chromosome segregation ATPase
MGIPDLEAVISRLEEAAEEARAATREANSAAKALRQAERDARATIADLEKAAIKTVEDRIREAIRTGLDAYVTTVREATSEGYDHVMAQFDRLMRIAMYGNEQGRGENIFDRLRARAEELDGILGAPGRPAPDPTLPALVPQHRQPSRRRTT